MFLSNLGCYIWCRNKSQLDLFRHLLFSTKKARCLKALFLVPQAFATPSHYGLYHHRLRFRWSSGKFSWWIQTFIFIFRSSWNSQRSLINRLVFEQSVANRILCHFLFSQVFMWNYLNRCLFCFRSLVVVPFCIWMFSWVIRSIFNINIMLFEIFIMWFTGVVKHIDSRRAVFQYSYQGLCFNQGLIFIPMHSEYGIRAPK